jgi:hypothetical protein
MTNEQQGTGGSGEGQNPSTSVTIPQADLDALREQIADLRSANVSVTEQYKQVVLRLLPEDQRKHAEEVLASVESQAANESTESALEARAKTIYAKELAFELKDYGVTEALLLEADSVSAMDAKAARLKADFLEQKLAGTSGNPGSTPSDRGTGGSGSGQHPAIEGKGISAVAAHIGQIARDKHNAR